MRLLSRLLALSVVAMGTTTISAAIVITQGPTSFSDSNILFNEPGLLNNGTVVEGLTNTSTIKINFQGAGENLTTPAAGQARVEGSDGSFTALTIVPANPLASFTTFVLNLNMNINGTVTFTVTPTVGAALVQAFAVSGAGENFFGFEGTAGTSIRSISLAISGTGAFAEDVRQVRVGGLGVAPSVIPEPSTYLLSGLGVALLALRRLKS